MPSAIQETLPEELLDQIVSVTTRDCLRNLCRTSKTLNRLATRYLYSNIYLKETDHLPALTYLILTSPAHAALVKSFIVPHTWAKDEDKFTEWSWPRSEDPDVPRVLRAKCAEYATSDKEACEMFGKIESGANEDAILALLLANLPELRRLNFNFGICNEHVDFVAMWHTIMNGIRSFGDPRSDASRSLVADTPQRTRPTTLSVPIDVMVTGADNKYFHYSVHLAMLIDLPNLRSIYGWRLGDNEGDPDPETSPFAKLKPRSCPVEYIELRCSKLHMDNIQYLLGATIPGKLKTFSYEVGCTWAWCPTEHPRIMASLQPHHDTLETLGLSHEYYYPYPAGADFEKPYPCSFTSFTALKHLKLAPVYIWGHDGFTDEARFESPETRDMLWKALPENLEELWLTRAHHEVVDNANVKFVPKSLLPALNLVIQNKSQAFPRLRHLRIELPLLAWEDGWLDALGLLCRTAATNGIQSTVIVCDMLDRWSKLTVELPWGWNEDIEWEPPRYSSNRECAKVWIVAAEQQDLGQALKDLKARFEQERERYNVARREIRDLGMLCNDCQCDPAYDASTRIDVPKLAWWVEQRLHTKSYWKACRRRSTVLT